MPQALLVLGCTANTPWGRDQIHRLTDQARQRGLQVWGADTQANLTAGGDDQPRMDHTVPLDVHDVGACRVWAAKHRDHIAAVATIRELSVLPAAWTAHDLGLAGNDPQAVLRIRRKDVCRDHLRRAGFPQPLTAECHNLTQAERFLRETGDGPWVVKPRDGLAGIGVTVVDKAADLAGAVAKFDHLPAAMGPLGKPRSFLVETYVDGDEYSAEGVMIGGRPQVLALTRKGKGDGFVETSHRMPSGLDNVTDAEARVAVAQALTTVGITHGIFHVEFWVTGFGIVLGELHDRGGGDYIHALVERTRPGFSLYGTLLDDLLGRPARPLPPFAGAACARFLLAAAPGRLRAVHGWDEATTHPSVIASHLQYAVGDIVPEATDSYTRPAVLVAGTDKPEDLDALIASLSARVTFDTAED
ncbi:MULTISPECIES: ATP-grasp domain-containing protein [unclassified Streptomyces]|uniref:ATP-grasp domain-containing protein n=1 Tax=unclassified Streptomyces TaxID=2593676 RepID=UPI000DAD581F|nr:MULTISPECIES: ATP-grasp domain-containing protein [unclassified Streptomyces]PZT72281.1 carboxylate--amine ligase [Streptomyces sp. AC1-42T]PZT81396.1 carboxylate--amine ligase [Streptomyces sp. AC1-42W]